MTRIVFLATCLLAFLACAWGVVAVRAAEQEEKKGIEVNLDGLKSRAPVNWKDEKPSSTMRFMQFVLPRVKDEKFDAELVIFKGIGGSTKDNLNRWKSMFIPPEGKKPDDVAKVTEMKVGEAEVTYLDVQGTYKHKARPFDPNEKEVLRPDYRLLGVVFETKNTIYHIRLVGPAKTVSHYHKGFDDWLKAFK